jgi:hypothetical protein
MEGRFVFSKKTREPLVVLAICLSDNSDPKGNPTMPVAFTTDSQDLDHNGKRKISNTPKAGKKELG